MGLIYFTNIYPILIATSCVLLVFRYKQVLLVHSNACKPKIYDLYKAEQGNSD